MTPLVLMLCTAHAATWWTEDPAQAASLAEVLDELWDDVHTVRVGEGGDGFVLGAQRLVWVGDADVREASVGSLREAVVLARSWVSEGPAMSADTWVPELPPAPRKERSWVLEDLDWGRNPGRYYAGFAVAVDRRAWGRVELASTTRVRSRLSAGIGDAYTATEVWIEGVDEPMAGPREFAAAVGAGLGFDLASGGLLVAPGAEVHSIHRLSADGHQTELALVAEIGHLREVDAFVATVKAPPWTRTGDTGRIEAASGGIAVAYRRRATLGWFAEAGLELRGPDDAARFARVGPTLAAGVRVDLGGV